MPKVFVQTGAEYPPRIYTSLDGITWAEQSHPLVAGPLLIDHVFDKWLVTQWDSGYDPGIMAYSANTSTWTQAVSPSESVMQMAENGTVAVAVDGWLQRFISSDGLTWENTIGIGDGLHYGTGVIWDEVNGLFIAVGHRNYSDPRMRTSPEGITWTVRTSPSTFRLISSIACDGAGKSVIVGRTNGSNRNITASSTNGIDWTAHLFSTDTYAHNHAEPASVRWADGQFVMVGFMGLEDDPYLMELIATSPDGDTFTEQSSGFGHLQYKAIAYGEPGPPWIVIGDNNASAITSVDAVTWDARTPLFPDYEVASDLEYNDYLRDFAADAIIKAQQAGTLTADSALIDYWITRANAVLQAAQSGSLAADAVLALDLDPLTDRVTHDRLDAHFGMTPANAVAHTAFSTVEAQVIALWARISMHESGLFHLESMTANSVLFRSMSGSFTAQSVQRATIGSSLVADSFLAGRLLADGVLLRVLSGSFTADGVLLRVLSGSFTADAITKAVAASSFTADGVIA